MDILSKNHSSYPRIGDEPGQQRLRWAFNQFDKGAISAEELSAVLDETVTEVIMEQISAGPDLVTDGMVRAYDPISHVAQKVKGFEVGGLLRFFDTNFYIRQPKVTSPLEYSGPLVAEEYRFARSKAGEKAIPVMIGPYSLLKMSLLNGGFEEELFALASIYTKELAILHKAGARLVQFEEPALLHYPEDLGLVETTYKTLGAGVDRPGIMLALYFGNATQFVERLNSLPVEGITFDFIYSPGLEAALAGFSKNIGVGIIDGRNTKMENADAVTRQVKSILQKVKSRTAYITTSCGLEFLPRGRAYDKLKLCSRVSRMLKGE